MIATGNLKDFNLSEIVKMSCVDIQTYQLTIKTSGGEGVIYFSNGRPFHAQLGRNVGEDAVCCLLDETEKNGGIFRVEPDVALPKRTITSSWENILTGRENTRVRIKDQPEVSSPKLKEENQMIVGRREAITKVLKNFKEKDHAKPLERYSRRFVPEQENYPRSMGRGQSLNQILANLIAREKDIKGAAIVSTEGFVIASALPDELEEEHVAAISAVMLSMGERITDELARGTLEQVLVRGNNGYVFLTQAGPDALLTILTTPEIKLGMVFLDAKRATAKLSEYLY